MLGANRLKIYQWRILLALMKFENTPSRIALRQALAELLEDSKRLEYRIEALLKENSTQISANGASG